MKTIDKNAPVLVTGASGYVAGWIIKYLLEEGHTVHATVRDTQKKSSTEHLHKIADSAPGKIHLFNADLLNDGDFEEAMQGCEVVIHTASPFVMNVQDPVKDLLDPALKGTENVLNSVNNVASVKRVVLTSSVVSVYGDNIEFAQSGKPAFDESDWNTTSSTQHQPYSYSKVMAEKRAWEMQKAQNRWDLVTINPSGIWGPSLTKSSKSTTIDVLLRLADGRSKDGVPDLTLHFVDVRNVAEGHLAAAFNPEVTGRHILMNETVKMLEMANILRAKYGDSYPFPSQIIPKEILLELFSEDQITRDYMDKNVGYELMIDNRKSLKKLGINYIDKHQTLYDQFEQFKSDGLI